MSGHPARKDQTVDRLFRTMRAAVELVRDLEPRLTDNTHLELKAAAYALLNVYAEITGLPKPAQTL